MKKDIISLTELSDYLGIPKRTIYDMVQDGRFPVAPIKNSQPKKWNIEEIDAWRFANGEAGK